MSTINNIYRFIEEEGLNVAEFSKKVGVSNGYFAKQRTAKGAVSSNIIEKIVSHYPKLNAEWLLTGKGQMVVSKPRDEERIKGIPLVSAEAIAGFGNNTFSIKEQDVLNNYVIPDFVDIDFMIKVKGDSMADKYNSGDIVACRILHQSKFIQWNRVYVMGTKEQGLLIKRLHPCDTKKCYKAVSDNTDYPPFELPQDEITGIALVVGVVRLE